MKYLMSVILILAAAAAAQAQGHLDVRTTVQKEEFVINEAGESETRLVPAEVVVPGESVIHTITFRNVSDEPADNVVITNPIAEDLMYLEGSAFGPGMNIEFSVDGGATFAAATDLEVNDAGVSRPATPDDFTHIRWVIENEIAPGAQGIAQFRARLD